MIRLFLKFWGSPRRNGWLIIVGEVAFVTTLFLSEGFRLNMFLVAIVTNVLFAFAVLKPELIFRPNPNRKRIFLEATLSGALGRPVRLRRFVRKTATELRNDEAGWMALNAFLRAVDAMSGKPKWHISPEFLTQQEWAPETPVVIFRNQSRLYIAVFGQELAHLVSDPSPSQIIIRVIHLGNYVMLRDDDADQ